MVHPVAMTAKLTIARIASSVSTRLNSPLALAANKITANTGKLNRRTGGTNQRITSLSANKTIQFRPEVFLIQLKTSLAPDCQHHLSRRGFVTATDIMALIAQTVLFAGFAATMAWADILTRPHTATSASVGTSGRRKKRFLLMLRIERRIPGAS